MRYSCLAFDYDGTLASHDKVNEEVLTGLTRLKNSGRRLVLVTGRILKDIFRIFPQHTLFDYVVAENGAVLYCPATRITKLLCEPVPLQFIEKLKEHNSDQLEIGNVIVASWHPHESKIIEVIQEFGLDLHISFNKGAVMILPAGVNKASGLAAALSALEISRHNTIGIGDGENDFVMLDKCECAVAVHNALPILKELADIKLEKNNGEGIVDFINHFLENEFLDESKPERHDILLGYDAAGLEIHFPSFDYKVLIAGPSQSGKSTACMSILDQMSTQGYQFCLIDPEGEYDRAPHSVIVGNEHYAPEISDVLRLLDNPDNNVVINLLGVPLNERSQFFVNLFSVIQELRRRKGRPHWLIIDEAHHMLNPYWNSIVEPIWQEPGALVMVTVDPGEISHTVLKDIDLMIAVGLNPNKTLNSFAKKTGTAPTVNDPDSLSFGQAELWFRRKSDKSLKVNLITTPQKHRRHLRKYAEGNLGEQRSFYFTGKKRKIKIKCQNLFLFMQIGDGLDDETWLYHLQRGDYSNWIHNAIRDPALAEEVKEVEASDIPNVDSRKAIRLLIEKRYSFPAQVLG